MSRKGFSLAEILIAVTLMGLIILAVASVDITSRRFFGTSRDEAWIQDEAKIAIQHIISRVQRGVGNMTHAGDVGDNPDSCKADGGWADSRHADVDHVGQSCSRGFYILDDDTGFLGTSGNRIQIKLDKNGNGKFDAGDETVEYVYHPEPYTLIYTDGSGNVENLADGIVSDAIFSFHPGTPPYDDDPGIPNQVDVKLTVRRHPEPGHPASLDNPETTLTSSIILRAMSAGDPSD